MPTFLSYARADAFRVKGLYNDLDRICSPVWMDSRLTGGQSWWDAILGQIQACDLFVVALSPESIRSEACTAELNYALALNRPLLPVLITAVHLELAPPEIARAHYVDYRGEREEALLQLFSAVRNATAPPLPDPLPDPPAAPLSYMYRFHESLEAPSLSFAEQWQLLTDLQGHYEQGGERREIARQLIERLRARHDIGFRLVGEIDVLLADDRSGSVPVATVLETKPVPAEPASSTEVAAPAPKDQKRAHQPVEQRPPAAQREAGHGRLPDSQRPPPDQSGPNPSGPNESSPNQSGPNQSGPGRPAGPSVQSGPVHPGPTRPAPRSGDLDPPYGTAVLVLGVLSLAICGVGLPLGVIGAVLGRRSLRQIDDQPGRYRGRSRVQAGFWLSIAGSVVGAIAVVYYIVILTRAS